MCKIFEHVENYLFKFLRNSAHIVNLLPIVIILINYSRNEKKCFIVLYKSAKSVGKNEVKTAEHNM